MTAKEMVEKYGIKKLIGKEIKTEPMGWYIGGIARVIDISLDPEAPEIVMYVDNPNFGEIGIFEYEEVSFIKD